MASNGNRQFVKYSFYQVESPWRRLPDAERQEGKEQILAVLDEFSTRMMIRSYSLAGTRGDTDFFLWMASERLEDIQEMTTQVWRTGLGKYLRQPHSYLAMTHRSQYLKGHRHAGQEGARLKVRPGNGKYFIVYPFVKTRQWYLLPKEERQKMMNTHFVIGHKYPSVKINTTYSFGIDDQEFVVGFETDSLSDFVDLVMDLRESEASSYTLRDTPIFTGVLGSFRETLDSLGG